MTTITLSGVSKTLGHVRAIQDVTLSVSPGELFFILGSSGSGKSTLLNLVAGLLEPCAGTILFDGRDVTRLATEARNAVLCFQSYALWPHMTVEKNVSFGLDARRLPAALARQRVKEALAQVRLTGLEGRYPGELSGGQQQRVALARALVVRPACLLLDEPLSNLDTKLRNEVRADIRRLCKQSGLTTLYVTHDQKEALSIADRIAVMHAGQVIQVDTPAVLYNKPLTRFVADFITQSNLVRGRVVSLRGACAVVETGFGQVEAHDFEQGVAYPGALVWVSIRPDQVTLVDSVAPPSNTFTAQCSESAFLGEWSEHQISLERDTTMTALRMLSMPARSHLPQRIVVHFPPESTRLLPGDG